MISNSKIFLMAMTLVAASVAWAEGVPQREEMPNLSHQREFETSLCPEGTTLSPGCEGDPQKAMELAAELFRQAGPKLGCRFVESCYLLVLGDQRPYGGWNGFIEGYQASDEEVFDQLNRYLVPRGLSIHPENPTWRGEGKVGAWSMYSLSGLEKRTRDCQISWMPRYQRSTGWAGRYRWEKQARSAYQAQPGTKTYHLMEGFMLGYPDAAIVNCQEVFARPFDTLEANIGAAYYYECGVPCFSYRTEDLSDPGIVRTEQEWSSFLERAYASGTHQQLAGQADFVQARLQRSPKTTCWYFEGQRRSGQKVTRSGSDRDVEEWFVQHRQELCGWLAQESDLWRVVEKIPAIRGREVTYGILVDILCRGLFQDQQPWAEMAQQTLRSSPKVASQFVQQQFIKAAQVTARLDGDQFSSGLPYLFGCKNGMKLFGELDSESQIQVVKALAAKRERRDLQELIQLAKGKGNPLASAWNAYGPK